MERLQQKKEDQEVAKYGDNNFWRISDEPAYDVDELLQELEDDDQSSGSPPDEVEQVKDDAPTAEVTDKDKNTENTDENTDKTDTDNTENS